MTERANLEICRAACKKAPMGPFRFKTARKAAFI
ncbi:hypothetical protein N480_17485 [Pseudoalteromonas luteoviolacea S2607]|uniref:Uncharacterized protein n=1 Tax=Pseudoalteromonas luteoviolacea S4060-1 TaxID=1365257 RepID=A0A167ILW9_9GAMM|nr:hypothetical protein N480_17485 [Pseudoalteromonas luteoviolacea S2607]KZN59695.1 hypothetical protein N478_08230 [Pseudoalteromonas luteoviolacea S4060-1]